MHDINLDIFLHEINQEDRNNINNEDPLAAVELWLANLADGTVPTDDEMMSISRVIRMVDEVDMATLDDRCMNHLSNSVILTFASRLDREACQKFIWTKRIRSIMHDLCPPFSTIICIGTRLRLDSSISWGSLSICLPTRCSLEFAKLLKAKYPDGAVEMLQVLMSILVSVFPVQEIRLNMGRRHELEDLVLVQVVQECCRPGTLVIIKRTGKLHNTALHEFRSFVSAVIQEVMVDGRKIDFGANVSLEKLKSLIISANPIGWTLDDMTSTMDGTPPNYISVDKSGNHMTLRNQRSPHPY